MKKTALVAFGSLVIAAIPFTLAAAPAAPIPVSPGIGGALQSVAATCPTLSWATTPGADGYELAVYVVPDAGELHDPVIRQKLPPGSSSWTLPAGSCLHRGVTYAWAIAAIGTKADLDWSEPALFTVSAGPTEQAFEQALEVVRSYLATAETTESSNVAAVPESEAPRASAAKTPAAPANTELSVDGNIDATSFSGSGLLLTDVAASTATQLAANPTDCPAGSSPLGVGASGNAEGCFDVTTQAELTSHSAGGDHDASYVNTSGDTVTGTLTLTAAADLVLGGKITQGGATLLHTTTGATSGNTAVGLSALSSATPGAPYGFSGSFNTAVGYEALTATTTAAFNTAVGYQALRNNASPTSQRNTATGYKALYSNNGGSNNTASGSRAMFSNTSGTRNTGIGSRALRYANAIYNTAVGYEALSGSGSGSPVTGGRNTAAGARALHSTTTGTYNVATGVDALLENTTGKYNVASGWQALRENSAGFRNTAAGSKALRNTTGHRNTALGQNAGVYATTGDDNVFIANLGTAGDDSKIRIGTQGTQTATFIAGISGVTTGGVALPVVVDANGQLGTAASGGAGVDADTLDGLDSSDLTTDAELASHGGDADVHHIRYTDAEAVSAMDTTADNNTLNHDRYTDSEALAAICAVTLAPPYCCQTKVVADFTDLGTFQAASVSEAGVTVTGSADVQVLQLNGLGIVGGALDVDVDTGESITFTFQEETYDVEYSILTYTFAGERTIEIFDSQGSLGTFAQDEGSREEEVSGLVGNEPITGFTITVTGIDHAIRIDTVTACVGGK